MLISQYQPLLLAQLELSEFGALWVKSWKTLRHSDSLCTQSDTELDPRHVFVLMPSLGRPSDHVKGKEKVIQPLMKNYSISVNNEHKLPKCLTVLLSFTHSRLLLVS